MQTNNELAAVIARHREVLAKATPRPWKTDSHVCAEEVYPKRGAPVYYTGIYHPSGSVNLTGDERHSPGSANAELVALAVNSHAILVNIAEAAGKLRRTCDEPESLERELAVTTACITLDAAFARLKEGK